jgi:hypothetical protein
MNEAFKKPGQAAVANVPASRKLPYQKPEFRHEGVFETMALSCGKISGTQGACNTVKKLS